MIRELTLLSPLLLGGCFASYNYVKEVTADGAERCEVSVNSTREVELGRIQIGRECETAGGAEGLSNVEGLKALMKFMELINSGP